MEITMMDIPALREFELADTLGELHEQNHRLKGMIKHFGGRIKKAETELGQKNVTDEDGRRLPYHEYEKHRTEKKREVGELRERQSELKALRQLVLGRIKKKNITDPTPSKEDMREYVERYHASLCHQVEKLEEIKEDLKAENRQLRDENKSLQTKVRGYSGVGQLLDDAVSVLSSFEALGRELERNDKSGKEAYGFGTHSVTTDDLIEAKKLCGKIRSRVRELRGTL